MSFASDPLEDLEFQCRTLEQRLAERTRQYQEQLELGQRLEKIISNGATLASHIAYLCSTLPEGSVDIEQAAQQLHAILSYRTHE